MTDLHLLNVPKYTKDHIYLKYILFVLIQASLLKIKEYDFDSGPKYPTCIVVILTFLRYLYSWTL
jgi:hypothetical protein